MDVFISWSGKRSGAAAEALRDWLPKIINALKPWLSAADIDKGARWSTEIATKLRDSKAGIICLTPSNVHAEWILFEAGALSKTIENTYVCPFLIGLEPADVKPPLAQFQATRATKSDALKLLKTLNSALGDAALAAGHIDEVFEVWWPKLKEKLEALPKDDEVAQATRSERDLLEEILALVRNQNRQPARSSAEGRDNLGHPWGAPVPPKVRDVILELDPKLQGLVLRKWDTEYVFYVDRVPGPGYEFVLPLDTPSEEVVDRIVSQIPDRIRADRAGIEAARREVQSQLKP